MSLCISGKKQYTSEAIAEDALIEAHSRYDYRKTTGPVAVYRCEDCGFYHLTSKGPMNKRLTEYLNKGEARLDQEAAKWLGKWKKR